MAHSAHFTQTWVSDTTPFDCIMLRYINKPTSSVLHIQRNLSETIQHSLSETIKQIHQETRQVRVWAKLSVTDPVQFWLSNVFGEIFSVKSLKFVKYLDLWLNHTKGSLHEKKKRNFMKKFHKTVTPPLYCFYEILIQKFDRISSTYVFLNKRYEIRLTPASPSVKFVS